MAVCIRLFLHVVRRLLLLDNRASCHRCRLERRGATAVGKYWRIADGVGVAIRANSSAPSPPLLVDGYSTRSRSVARHKTGLSQLAFLFRARCGVPRVFSVGGASVAQTFRRTRQKWQSSLHDRNAKGIVHRSPVVRALSDVRRVRLANESELSLVFDNVWRLHLRRRGWRLD